MPRPSLGGRWGVPPRRALQWASVAAKRRKRRRSVSTPKQQPYKLSKGTLSRIVLAHSFAEYDPLLQKQGVFVETPAARAAEDGTLGKCIFVGRRGSGKTAISLHLSTL